MPSVTGVREYEPLALGVVGDVGDVTAGCWAPGRLTPATANNNAVVAIRQRNRADGVSGSTRWYTFMT
jgi:hypothetical protein